MPLVHRCGEPGCREMIPLKYRYCTKHYNAHYQAYLHRHSTGVAARAYEYHRRRQTKHYDTTKRFAEPVDAQDTAADELAKSFGLKVSAKDSGKELAQSSRAKFYRSKQWLAVRSAIYSRDIGCCQVCGRSENRMYVDHIVPLRLCSNKERVASSNLWTLCGKCHNKKSRQEAKTSDKKLQRMSRLDWQRVLKN